MFARAVNEAAPSPKAQPALGAAGRFIAQPKQGQQNANIMSRFARPPQPRPTSGQVGRAPEPLIAKPLNRIPPPPVRREAPTASSAMSSLCGTSGSFNHTLPAVPNLAPNATTAVYFSENDFSDDETLVFDSILTAPSALPSVPPPKAPPPPPQARDLPTTPLPSVSKASAPVDPQPTQYIPWSSSPAEHFAPRRQSTETTLVGTEPSPEPVTLKRLSPDQAAPPAKRRRLPKDWAKEEEPVQEEGSRWSHTSKAKDAIWDPTTSAVKEQKRQLKSQSKRPAMEHFEPPAPPSSAPQIVFTKEQQDILDLVVKQGKSVFFTGPAGAGKSVLMRRIIDDLKKKYGRESDRVAVTASTGLAACNISGTTLHSFSGIGLGKAEATELVRKIKRNKKAKDRWLRTKVLIIDEISMVDGDLFDKLGQVGRVLRNNGRPWGGIQLVVTGDFFQLPPVPDGDKREASKFAFDAATWSTSIEHTIGLTEIFRQRDPEFAGMLNEMRLGRISDATVRSFKSLERKLTFLDGLDVTELFPTRREVDMANVQRLRSLPGEVHTYEAADSGDPLIKDRLLQNMMAPKLIELKVGAQVMLIKNMDADLVNGSIGQVIDFMSESQFDATGVMPEDGFDGAVGLKDSKKKIRALGMEFDDDELRGTKRTLPGNKTYPVVQFPLLNGSSRVILCVPEPWKVELPTGEVQAQRDQVPLILAWALSIHKAQGQTLERVKVDLQKVFEKGQAYVALSRATTKQGLQVLGFDKRKVMAHPRVVEFYNQLYSAEKAVEKAKPAQVRMTDFLNVPAKKERLESHR